MNNTYIYILKGDKRNNKCIQKRRTRNLVIFHTNKSKFLELPKKKTVIKKMLTEWGNSSWGK